MIESLLARSSDLGVRLWVEAGQLHYAGPRHGVDQNLLAELRDNKAELIIRLNADGTDAPERWLQVSHETAAGPVFVVLPAAGAGPNDYGAWPDGAPGPVALVNSPGHGERLFEAALEEVGALADQVAAVLAARWPTRPLVLVGHSAGAHVAHEVTLRLGPSRVALLVVAAARSPHLLDPEPGSGADELTVALAERGRTTSDEAGEPNPELRGRLAATMTADLRMMASARKEPTTGSATPVPVLALHGTRDAIGTDAMAGWGRWTSGGFRLAPISGGHFFPMENAPEVRAVVAAHHGALSRPG